MYTTQGMSCGESDLGENFKTYSDIMILLKQACDNRHKKKILKRTTHHSKINI